MIVKRKDQKDKSTIKLKDIDPGRIVCFHDQYSNVYNDSRFYLIIKPLLEDEKRISLACLSTGMLTTISKESPVKVENVFDMVELGRVDGVKDEVSKQKVKAEEWKDDFGLR